MDFSLSFATWLWLLLPMCGVVILSLISWLLDR